MADKISWRRVLVEGIVIVFSILLAFGIDAWWEERGERLAERDALVSLYAEFEEIRERIEDNRLFRQDVAAVEALYEMVQAFPVDGEALPVADIILVRAVGGVTFESATPVLDGLIRSDRLEIIRDPPVRIAISEWQAWLTQLDERERESQTFTNTQLRPALVAHGNMARVFASARSFGYVQLNPDGVTALRIDNELRALVAARLGYAGGLVEIRGLLVDSADSVLIASSNAQDR